MGEPQEYMTIIKEKHIHRAIGILRSKGNEEMASKLVKILPVRETIITIPREWEETMSKAINECAMKAQEMSKCAWCGGKPTHMTEWLVRRCDACLEDAMMSHGDDENESLGRIGQDYDSEYPDTEEEEDYGEYINRRIDYEIDGRGSDRM